MRTVEEIVAQRQNIGKIIDDRSLNRIPFYAYVKEYEKLDAELQKAITTSKWHNNKTNLGGYEQ